MVSSAVSASASSPPGGGTGAGRVAGLSSGKTSNAAVVARASSSMVVSPVITLLQPSSNRLPIPVSLALAVIADVEARVRISSLRGSFMISSSAMELRP